MRQYVIDELRYADFEKVSAYLKENFEAGGLGGIYKLPVDEEVLSSVQKSHDGCRPHYVIVDLDETRISCEFLIRTAKSLKCDCASMADETQRNWIIGMVDAIFEKLELTY